ncbi:MAG: hypothetical protein RLO52_31215 [Sandaracinaceae bacterium]
MRVSLALALLLTACDGEAALADPAGAPAEGPGDTPRAADYRSPRVQQAMESASDVVQTRGFSALGEPWRGFLVDQAADVREQPMRAGTCYLVLGAGSSALRELNLRVFDSDGGEVVQDAMDGASAALRFCPSQSGTYFVAVRAAAGSGLFEVRIFRGPTGLEVRMDDLFRDGAAEASREGR